MEIEEKFAGFISETNYDDLPSEPVDITKTVILTVLGTIIAGATIDVTEAILEQVRDWGGKEEATILIHGGKVPAHNAALVNSVMARALDFCDVAYPGIHIGSAAIPAALAAAELAEGCSGKELLNALIVGTEVAHRINQFSLYNGLDPSGICGIFSATSAAGKILGLNRDQMLHALAIAFNKAAGSMQSNVEGALSVVLIQGFTAQSAIVCSQIARKGLTGPKSFLTGTFGYFHLFNNDKYETKSLIGEIGTRFELINTVFKRYPSCGLTQSSTAGVLKLMKEKNFTAEEIERVDITVGPFVYKMVGQPYEVGNNPKVNAQYSIPYCVANALLRKSSMLKHFDESYIMDPQITPLTDKIHVRGDADLENRGLRAMDMEIRMKNGEDFYHSTDYSLRSPEGTLSEEDHLSCFQDCISYGGKPLAYKNVDKLVYLVNELEKVEDIRSLIPLLTSDS